MDDLLCAVLGSFRSQPEEHGARPTRSLRPPSGEHLAAQRARPSLRGPRIHNPGQLGEREGAGRWRTGSGAADPERALSAHWDGGRTTTHAIDIEGPQAESSTDCGAAGARTQIGAVRAGDSARAERATIRNPPL